MDFYARIVSLPARTRRVAAALVAALAMAALAALWVPQVRAQLEGAERGVAPLANTGDFEVFGVKVDVEGDNAFDARKKGWEEAQRQAWKMLYKRTQGGETSGLSDGALNNIVSAIVVEQENVGPKRYIATLGVMFDRARAGQILGVGGRRLRSPPLLVLPIMWTGGAPQVFENQTEWQKAWARFRSGDSAIDYVRPYGSGAESLVLTAGQAMRPDRRWWRNILDQFGAADVIIPIARLDFDYPGGPVTARFTARHGPDSRYIGSFTLRTRSSAGIAAMMDQAIQRLDTMYTRALSQGILKTDRSLTFSDDEIDLEALEAEIEAELAAEERAERARRPERPESNSGARSESTADLNRRSADATAEGNTLPPPQVSTQSVTVQFSTPDVGAVGRAEASVRGVPGVSSAATSSVALGGVSVMRVSYAGPPAALASALRSRGWTVSQSGASLRISRPAPRPQPAAPVEGDGPATEPGAQP